MPCKNWQNNNNIISCSYHKHLKGLFFSFVFSLGCEAYFLLPAAYYYKEPTCTHTLNSTVLSQQRRPEYCLLCSAVFFTAVPLSHPDAWPEQLWGRQAPLCPILHINNYMYFGYFHGGLSMWLWYAEQPNFVCIFISFRLNTQPDVIFASPVEQPLRAAHSLRSVDPAARWIQPSTIIKQKKTS